MKSSHLGTKPAKESITGLPNLNKLVGQKAHVKPEDRERKAKPKQGGKHEDLGNRCGQGFFHHRCYLPKIEAIQSAQNGGWSTSSKRTECVMWPSLGYLSRRNAAANLIISAAVPNTYLASLSR